MAAVTNFFASNPAAISSQILSIMPDVVPVSVNLDESGSSEIIYAPVGTPQRGMDFPVTMPFIFGASSDVIYENRAYMTHSFNASGVAEEAPNFHRSVGIFKSIANQVSYEIHDAHYTGGDRLRELLIYKMSLSLNNSQDPYQQLSLGLYFAHSTLPKVRMKAYAPLIQSAKTFISGYHHSLAALTFELAATLANHDAKLLSQSEELEDTCEIDATELLTQARSYWNETVHAWTGTFVRFDDNRDQRSKLNRTHRLIFSRYAAGQLDYISGSIFTSQQMNQALGELRDSADDLMRMAYFSSLQTKRERDVLIANNLLGALSIYKSINASDIDFEKLEHLAKLIQDKDRPSSI